MPFCPKCRYEYREGVAKCPDCDEKLVDALPEEPEPGDVGQVDLVCAATYPYEAQAQQAKMRLETCGTPAALVNEIMSQTDPILVFADGGVRVMVRRDDLSKARKVLQTN